jgi:excisionase family DNA binding protein
MRVEDVAEALGQSKSTIYRKVSSGEIPHVKLGHGPSAHIRVPAGAFFAWLYGEDEA